MKTRDQITAVLDAAPTLTARGYLPRRHPDNAGRYDHMTTPDSVAQFEAACRFIGKAGMTKNWSTRSPSSYGLKHTAERWADTYIANGVFIAAAMHMGAPVQRCESNSPNAYIGLRKLGLKALERAAR